MQKLEAGSKLLRRHAEEPGSSAIMMIIKPAQREDIPTIAKIEKELFPQPWSQKDFQNLLAQETFWFWVAKEKNSVVGYLVCQVVQKEAELHNIAVAKEYQKQGVGRELLQKLIKELYKKEIEELFLMVRASNVAAQRLYEEAGFRKVSIRSGYYNEPKEEGWIYQRNLF